MSVFLKRHVVDMFHISTQIRFMQTISFHDFSAFTHYSLMFQENRERELKLYNQFSF